MGPLVLPLSVHMGKVRSREEITLPGLCPLPTKASLNVTSSSVRCFPVQPREMPGLKLLRGYLSPTP